MKTTFIFEADGEIEFANHGMDSPLSEMFEILLIDKSLNKHTLSIQTNRVNARRLYDELGAALDKPPAEPPTFNYFADAYYAQ